MFKNTQYTERKFLMANSILNEIFLKINSILNENVLRSWMRTRQDDVKRGLKEGGKRRYLERLNDRMNVKKKRT